MSKTLIVVIPLTPPSVNHYMKYRVATINGIATVMSYHSSEAKAWWKAVGVCAGGRSLDADGFEVAYVVYQGKNERGDVDNYGKCILDSIVKAGVIDSDHKVTAMHAYKSRDRANPRTEIFIRPVGQLALLEAPMPAKEEW